MKGAGAVHPPEQCVDCGACEPVCPVEAIHYEDDVPAPWAAFTADNVRFFTDPLPDAAAALDSPGGAAKIGAVGVDTPLVTGYPPGDP